MNDSSKDYLFVGLQMLLFCLFILPISNQQFVVTAIGQWIGGLLAGIGIIILLFALVQLWESLSPFPSPKTSNKLKTKGLYKFIRHPIYSGIILSFLGWSLVQGNYWKLMVTTILLLLFYFKSSYEEQRLINRYGDEYLNYKERTGRFFPKLY